MKYTKEAHIICVLMPDGLLDSLCYFSGVQKWFHSPYEGAGITAIGCSKGYCSSELC